jgi:hypothetical protein
MSATALDDPEIRNWPLWWFARLQTSLEHGDTDAAREALEHLARLGFEVRFLLPPEVHCA